LTSFGCNKWLFEQLRSYSILALLTVLSTLSMLLLSPVGGALADRLPRVGIRILRFDGRLVYCGNIDTRLLRCPETIRRCMGVHTTFFAGHL
jgi:hypothetical protein